MGFYAENHPAPLISQDSGPYPEIFDPSRSSTFLPLSLPVSMPIQMDHRPSVLSDNSFDPRPYNLSTRYPSQHFQALSPYFSAPSPFLAPSSDYSANCASQTTQSWSPSLYQPLPPTYPVPFSSDYYPHFAPIWSPGQMDSPPPAPTYGMFASSSYSPQSIEYAPTSPFLNHLIGDFPGPSANALLHSQRGPIPCSACDTIARSQAAPDPLSSALGSGGISTIPSQNRPGTKRCAWVTDRTTNQTCNMTFQHGNALQLHCENVHIEPIQKGVAQTWCCEWQGCARQRKPLRARAALWIHVYSHTGCEEPTHHLIFSQGGNRNLSINLFVDHVAHCQLCNAAFSDFRHLDEHMRAHSLEKPYQCVFCSEVAPNIAALSE